MDCGRTITQVVNDDTELVGAAVAAVAADEPPSHDLHQVSWTYNVPHFEGENERVMQDFSIAQSVRECRS